MQDEGPPPNTAEASAAAVAAQRMDKQEKLGPEPHDLLEWGTQSSAAPQGASSQTTSVDAGPGRADILEQAQLTVTLGATADQAAPESDVQQVPAPIATPVPPDSDTEGSQHGPYVVIDYSMGFEFQVPWDQVPPGTTWVPGRWQGEYRLVPLHQRGVFAPQT